MLRAIRSWTRRFARAEDGVSAVEFALIAPLMILFYFGLAELSQAYMAQRRVNHAAAAVADLVAQQKDVNTAKLEQIFFVGELTMAPFDAEPLKLRLTSVVAGADGVGKAEWSQGHGLTARPKDQIVATPAGLLTPNASLIMAEVEYDYVPTTGEVMPALTHFTHTYYLAPRTTQKVVFKP